ncbi:MAG: hypothetical protein ACRBK7_04940 [Acidimicrobiales bacterium]
MTLHRVHRRRSSGPGVRAGVDAEFGGRVDQRRSVRRKVLDVSIAVLAKTWWVATAAVALVGGAVHFDLVTEGNLGPLAGTSEVAAGNDASFAAVDSEFDTYPNTRYAGVDLAVIDARIVPVNQTGAPIAVIELGVRNNNSTQARLPLKMVSLIGPNGVQTELDRFEYTEYSTRMVVEPWSTDRGLAVFKLSVAASVSLADYHLQIAENGRWPVTVPLDSSALPRAEAYPQALEIALIADQLNYRGMSLELIEAFTALEYGVYRAPIGRHLAVITVDITGSPASAMGTVESELWTLTESKVGGNNNIVSQNDSRAIRALAGENPVDGSTVTDATGAVTTTARVHLVFSYSTEASRLSLQIGGADAPQAVAEFKVQAFE